MEMDILIKFFKKYIYFYLFYLFIIDNAVSLSSSFHFSLGECLEEVDCTT